MMTILVTGANGFVGKNLCVLLKQHSDVCLHEYDLGNTEEELEQALAAADIIFHLAGVNRPDTIEEFHSGNAGFTSDILRILETLKRTPKIILSSSIQAELENPYGVSKREAEDELRRFCEQTGAIGVVYRLKNLFGKWCRPNYNSVTATFCHNIAHDLPVQISEPKRRLELTYIDDVIAAFVGELPSTGGPGCRFAAPLPSYTISLEDLAETIRSFRDSRSSLQVPNFDDAFTRYLYGTYLTYLDDDAFAYDLDQKTDNRGTLAEFVKSPPAGQIFVSNTKPGITRGNHYHHTKTEKFLVLAGKGIIRFRKIDSSKVLEYPVSGSDFRVVDIPPGYTHSIENVGETEMVTLFWSSEIFDATHTDTCFEPVILPDNK
jgi:UDP-2-acetamido-2,6-beta-L-arabino-hexul-4-ose reductase